MGARAIGAQESPGAFVDGQAGEGSAASQGGVPWATVGKNSSQLETASHGLCKEQT